MSQSTSYRKGSVIVTFRLSTNSHIVRLVKMYDGNEDRLARSLEYTKRWARICSQGSHPCSDAVLRTWFWHILTVAKLRRSIVPER